MNTSYGPPFGGPAFPCAGSAVQQTGMTLRDYFAGQALMGLLSHMRSYTNDAEMSRWAYSLADAMLAAGAADEEGGAS